MNFIYLRNIVVFFIVLQKIQLDWEITSSNNYSRVYYSSLQELPSYSMKKRGEDPRYCVINNTSRFKAATLLV